MPQSPRPHHSVPSNEDPLAPISVPDFDADSFLQNNGFDFDAMGAMPPARLTAVPAGILLVLARIVEIQWIHF
ncbi:hypothetical protein B0H14DRAFT_3428381 [Mycena olivaceomarginata]|nr:hypothetical protein B0H14DRAFT_3428381 [Mycena olivaceomarginata]